MTSTKPAPYRSGWCATNGQHHRCHMTQCRCICHGINAISQPKEKKP